MTKRRQRGTDASWPGRRRRELTRTAFPSARARPLERKTPFLVRDLEEKGSDVNRPDDRGPVHQGDGRHGEQQMFKDQLGLMARALYARVNGTAVR